MPCPSSTSADGWERDPIPLLTAGGNRVDGIFDTAVADPDVMADPQTGLWRLWYQTGRAKSYTSDDSRMIIRYAQSADEGKILEVAGDPALSLPDDSSAWDAANTETPSVVFDPAAPEDRRYKMYYSGASKVLPLGFPDYQIGLAVSADGITFTRLSADESPYHLQGLVLRVAEAMPDLEGLAGGVVADPEIQLIHGVYHLWFSSFANDAQNRFLAFGISHAVSADGIHWTPSANNPIPSLRNSDNVGGQQPSVAWNPALNRWEMWFTLDSDAEANQIPSTFNPAYGFWMATSEDALAWQIDYSAGRDFHWQPNLPDETYGLLTGADVLITRQMRHIFYTAWGSRNIPEGFLVPVRDSRQYVPAVLNLIHATKCADRQ
jgi:hypothetical protein